MNPMDEIMTQLQIKSESGSEPIKPMNDKEYEQWKADQANELSGDLDKKDGYNCEKCKNRGFTSHIVYNEMFNYYATVARICECERIRKGIRRLNRSGLKNIVQKYTFDKYETPDEWQKLIKKAAIRFCSDTENNWFFIGGMTGAGKSHICTAIATTYIKRGKNCHYMLWRDEIARLKAIVNDAEQYEKAMRELKETDVLYIDDLFKSGKGEDGKPKAPTVADVNAAFEIINYRYNNPKLVTIISSERTLTDMFNIDEAIAGRIVEKTKECGYCFNLRYDRSRNWRLKGLEEI